MKQKTIAIIRAHLQADVANAKFCCERVSRYSKVFPAIKEKFLVDAQECVTAAQDALEDFEASQ